MSSSSAPAPSSRHDAVQFERRDAHRGRVINRSAALQKRREEFAANARPVGAGTSTIYDWTTSLTASPVQLKAFDGAIEELHDAVSVGNHEVWGDPLPSHLQYRKRDGELDAGTADAHTIAKRGVGGPGSPLPHGEVIQKAFGRHDLSDVKAHLGGHAQEASTALGAEAYATGSDIAFAGTPTLHTAAHEAAHIIQQRAGVSLKDGIGESGDRYERHADEVADAVVRGQSAEPILDRMAIEGHGASSALQREEQGGPHKGGNRERGQGPPVPIDPRPSILATLQGVREKLKEPAIERWLFDDSLGLLVGNGSSAAQDSLGATPSNGLPTPKATGVPPQVASPKPPSATPRPPQVASPKPPSASPRPPQVASPKPPSASRRPPQRNFSDAFQEEVFARTAPAQANVPKADIDMARLPPPKQPLDLTKPPPRPPQINVSDAFQEEVLSRTAPARVDVPKADIDMSKMPPPKEQLDFSKPPPPKAKPVLDSRTKARIRAGLKIADKTLAVIGIFGGVANILDGEKELQTASDAEGQVSAKLKILQGISGVAAGIATLAGMVPVAVVGGIVAAGLQLRARGAEFAKKFDLQYNDKDSIGNGLDAGQAFMDRCGEGVACALGATIVGTATTLYFAVAEVVYGILGTLQDICEGIASLFESIMSPPGSLGELLKELSPDSSGPRPPDSPSRPERPQMGDLDTLDERGRSPSKKLPMVR